MSCTYQGTIFDKRGCYVILPASPFWRLDANDNTADGDEEVEVLEGPEVEIRDSCAVDEGADMGEADVLAFAKSEDESQDSDNNCNQQGQRIHFPKKKVHAEADNKYYEVEAILDGPKKRREHLFKVCYKVRWKGYGPESDTWQPIADLVNVQDMIEDYKKEKDTQKHDKFKKKPLKNLPQPGTDCLMNNHSRVSSSSSSPEGKVANRKQYDPVYGTVKDKFWKDLELGRHQNHSHQFNGDMYSKVKGCRRAAHTEALTSIHKQRRRKSKSLHNSRSSLRVLRGDYFSKSRSSSPVSSRHRISSRRSESPPYSHVTRPRKRSSDSFCAAGYTSMKRSRRSREAKNGNLFFEVKQPSIISSVTSETVAIVTMSNPLTPPVVSNTSAAPLLSTSSSTVSSDGPVVTVCSRSSSPDAGETSESDDSADEYDCNRKQSSVMIVSSETMLTVTTESKRLDDARFFYEDVRCSKSHTKTCLQSEDMSKIISDVADSTCSSMVNGGASGCEVAAGASFDACGGTSGGSLPDDSQMHKGLVHVRSALDAQSEASGAVHRSHDAECLWNGACNRSDCKSNRRRNMKNGQGKYGGVVPATGDDDDVGGSNVENDNTAMEEENDGSDSAHLEYESLDTTGEDNPLYINEGEEVEGACSATEHTDDNILSSPSASSTKSSSKSNKESTGGAKPSGLLKGTSFQSSSSSRQDSSPSLSPASSSSRRDKSGDRPPSGHSSRHKSSSQQHSSVRDRRLLYSSCHTDSSDSSFDDTTFSVPSLSREAVSDSFCRTAKQSDIDTLAIASTSETYTPSSLTSHRSLTGGSSQGRKSYMEAERPGLFSQNNGAFMFLEQELEDSHSTSTRERSEEGLFSQAPSSLAPLSPGKENSDSTSGKTGGLTAQSGYSKLKVNKGGDVPSTRSGSHVRPQPRQARMEDSEARPGRARSSDVSQPLEKIPSPNSRDCELNQRIVTLTCDELEDFVEQGEEHYSRKDTGFISNADILQAVNLSKAEVIKRAIKQIRSNEHKLDFEQTDITGLTLLMRAVQRGALAIVEMLLEHGVNVNSQQTNGTTALMIAADQNGTCLVALLLKFGANSSLYTINSDQAETALMKAIKKQNRDVVNLMLRVGVNIAPPTCGSFSALELAVERRNAHIEGIVRFHCQRLEQAFRSRILATLDGTANLLEPLFCMQCFPLRESVQFVVKFNGNIHPVAPGEGFLLFIAHTKITEKGVKCRFHGVCPISSVTLNGIVQSPLTKDVHFVTSCHPIIQGCNTLVINKLPDYTSKAKLVAQAFRAKILPG